jgi:hypothetical protein
MFYGRLLFDGPFPSRTLNKYFQEKENDLLRIDDIAEIDVASSSEINSKFTMYLKEGDNEKRREPFYCKELGKYTLEIHSPNKSV